MKLYRLVDDKGGELTSFEAEEDAKGARRAREWVGAHLDVDTVFTLQGQRSDGGVWEPLQTWVPRSQKPVWVEPSAWSDGRTAKRARNLPPTMDAR